MKKFILIFLILYILINILLTGWMKIVLAKYKNKMNLPLKELKAENQSEGLSAGQAFVLSPYKIIMSEPADISLSIEEKARRISFINRKGKIYFSYLNLYETDSAICNLFLQEKKGKKAYLFKKFLNIGDNHNDFDLLKDLYTLRYTDLSLINHFHRSVVTIVKLILKYQFIPKLDGVERLSFLKGKERDCLIYEDNLNYTVHIYQRQAEAVILKFSKEYFSVRRLVEILRNIEYLSQSELQKESKNYFKLSEEKEAQNNLAEAKINLGLSMINDNSVISEKEKKFEQFAGQKEIAVKAV